MTRRTPKTLYQSRWQPPTICPSSLFPSSIKKSFIIIVMNQNRTSMWNVYMFELNQLLADVSFQSLYIQKQ
jgi:hypothetical protein